MAKQPKTDPKNPKTSNVNLDQRRIGSPDSNMTGIIMAGVILLIVAIVAFNYGWFGGSDANVTQNNTTETVPQATAPDTATSTTVTEPDASTTTSTTTTEPSATGTGTTTTTTDP